MSIRFKEFLAEEDREGDVAFKTFLSNCSDYFKYADKHDFYKVLYRGDKKKPKYVDLFFMNDRDVEAGRPPTDTPLVIHDIANEIFEDEFGHRFRNGMMASGNRVEASEYGNVYVIIPANGFTLCYSPVWEDFYKGSAINITVAGVDETVIKKKVRVDIDVGRYKAGAAHLKNAIDSRNEVMLFPEEGSILQYYMFTPDFWMHSVMPRLEWLGHQDRPG